MLRLIFFPFYLALELATLPFRLLGALFHGAFWACWAVVGAISLVCSLLNILRPLMGVILLFAGLSILYRLYVEKGVRDFLGEFRRKMAVRA